MTPVLQFDGISKAFGRTRALDQVSFAVHEGEIHALLGENGAGKTTLMKILVGLCRADAGTMLLRGRPIRFYSPREALANRIGMVHQHLSLLPSLTVIGSKTPF